MLNTNIRYKMSNTKCYVADKYEMLNTNFKD